MMSFKPKGRTRVFFFEIRKHNFWSGFGSLRFFISSLCLGEMRLRIGWESWFFLFQRGRTGTQNIILRVTVVRISNRSLSQSFFRKRFLGGGLGPPFRQRSWWLWELIVQLIGGFEISEVVESKGPDEEAKDFEFEEEEEQPKKWPDETFTLAKPIPKQSSP